MTGRGPDGLLHWDEQPEMTEDNFDRNYTRLLERGVTSCLTHQYEAIGRQADEKHRLWREMVAEPWWEAMRARAARDGLAIGCFTICNNLWTSVGLDNDLAVAELLKPAGTAAPSWNVDAWRYPHATFSAQEVEQLMLADWGETLTSARTRSPAEPGSHDGGGATEVEQ
jgi:hypothetical protein